MESSGSDTESRHSGSYRRQFSRTYSNFDTGRPRSLPRNKASHRSYADSGTGSRSSSGYGKHSPNFYQDNRDTGAFSDRGDDQPLPLIEFKRENGVSNKLHLLLNHEILDEVLISCQNRKICSIFVTGTIRSGKSFILNCIMNKLQDLESDGNSRRRQDKEFTGFPFKAGYQGITKGIWVWSRAFCVTTSDGEIAVLLFDTEGIDDELAKPDEIFAILGLSLLSSSLLIFNASGSISPLELEWIFPLCDKADREQLPELSVLIRDWTDFAKFDYDGTSYLESVLKQMPSAKNSQIQWNCTVMPHIGEFALSKDYRGRESGLDKEFRDHLYSFLDLILNQRNISTKSLFRNDFTKKEFSFFFVEAVQLIDSTLDPSNNLESTNIWPALNECIKKFKIQNGLNEYTNYFQELEHFAPAGYLQDTVIEDFHKNAKEKAIQAFKAFKFRLTEEVQLLKILEQRLNDLNLDLKHKNSNLKTSKYECAFHDTVQIFENEIQARFALPPIGHLADDADLFHYDVSLLTEQIELAKQKAEENFLAAFPGVIGEEKNRLITSLHKKLGQLTDDVKIRNADNCKKAQEIARDITEKFMNRYDEAMQSHFRAQKLSNINAGILNGLHYLERQKIDNELACINLGSVNFTKETVNHIKSSIDEKLEDFMQSLKPIENTTNVSVDTRFQACPDEKGITTQARSRLVHQDSSESVTSQFTNGSRLSGENFNSAGFSYKEKTATEFTSFVPTHDEAKQEQVARAASSAQNRLLELQNSLDNILLKVDHMTLNECKNLALAEFRRLEAEFSSNVDLQNLDYKNVQHILNTFNIEARQIHEKFGEKLMISSQKSVEHLMDKNLKLTLDKAIAEASKEFKEEIESRMNNLGYKYFSNSQLQQESKNICNNILLRLSRLHDLNSNQRSQLEESLLALSKKFKEQNDIIKRTFEDDIAIGIDLGTTYCCVAAYNKGKVEIVRNKQGENTTPSYVLINKNGTTIVGSAAKDKAFRNPEATIYDAKRIIGRRPGDPKLQDDMKFWPFNVKEIDGNVKIEVHGKNYHPEEISSMVLKHLKEDAEQFLGLKIKKAVITVPAYFSDAQRQATIEAGELAELEVLGILNEPTAAALAYRLECFDAGRKRNILVYDFGGGTFDVSILSLSDSRIEVLGISGDTHLGGEDIDKNMMDYCAQSFQNETGIDLFEGKDDVNRNMRSNARRCLNRLQKECEKTKKSIAGANTEESICEVSIDSFVNGEDLVVEVTRKIFDDINLNLYKKTIEITENALSSAEMTTDDIDDVIVVGGSTRIKKIQDMLSEHFGGKTLCHRLNPDEAIAYGAAVQAASLNCKSGKKIFDFGTIQEVTPMSLGVQLMDKSMDIIIPRNTKIPTTHTETYKTHVDGQTSVSIPIYQGEHESTEMNTLLGTFNLKGIPPGPAGSEIVDVTMTINRNGILTVEAVCRSTKGKICLKISDDRAGYNKAKKERQLAEVSLRDFIDKNSMQLMTICKKNYTVVFYYPGSLILDM